MRNGKLAVADPAKDILCRMRHGFEAGKPQEAAGALDRMHYAKNAAQKRRITGTLLQFHNLAIQQIKRFTGFRDEILQKIIHLQ